MSDQTNRNDPYGLLGAWLLSCPAAKVTVTLAEVEETVGIRLPARAWSDPHWWDSAPRNTWARSWLRADRAATLDIAESRVTFISQPYSPAVNFENAARQRTAAIGYARARLSADSSLWEGHVKLGWWEPHTVYVLHKNPEALYKVGVTNARSDRRIREQTAKGRADLVTATVVPNKWDAVLVEGRVLELTEHARKYADPFTYFNGQTEHWEDTVAPPGLSPIITKLAADEALAFWGSSLDRQDPRANSALSTDHE